MPYQLDRARESAPSQKGVNSLISEYFACKYLCINIFTGINISPGPSALFPKQTAENEDVIRISPKNREYPLPDCDSREDFGLDFPGFFDLAIHPPTI